MIAKRLILTLATVGALAFSGCGSGDEPGVATTPASTNPVGSVASTPAAAAAEQTTTEAAPTTTEETTTEAAPTTTEAAPTTTEEAPAAAPAATGPVTISAKDIAFNPKEVTVKAGTKITWSMDEPVPHDVVANSGADFKSEILNEGQTFEFTPKKPGTIEYECTLHPGMVGTITVQ
jgi:plastocyanin